MRPAYRLALTALLSSLPFAPAGAGVQLSSFTGSGTMDGVRLDWTTSSETNNFGFYVQRSLNAQTDYQTVPGSFTPGAGTTVIPQSYTYTDAAAGPGTWYYRLQQVDLDGPTHYTPGIVVHRPVYGQYLPDTTTRLMLHLDETAGAIAHDLSSYRTHGSVTGAVVAPGRFGSARGFAGGTHRIEVPDTPSLRAGVLTVEAWINAPAYAAMGPALIVGKRRATGAPSYALRMSGASGRVWFGTGIGGADTLVSATPLSDGLWHHVAGVYDGGALHLYVNGVLEGSRPLAGTIPYDGSGLFIGQDSGGAAAWQGTIDEVRLSSSARGPGEFNLRLPPAAMEISQSAGTVLISWQNGGGGVGLLRYRIYRGIDSTALSLRDSAATNSYLDTQPPPGGMVYYRVTAVDSTGFEGRAGATVGLMTPPAPPALIAPGNDTSGLTFPVLLRWHAVPGAAGYRVQVAPDPLFAVPLLDDSTATDTTLTLPSLPLASRYYWQVSSRGSGGTGAPSTVWSFAVRVIVPVTLLPGWNMISLPVETADDSLPDVYPTSLFPYAFAYVPQLGYFQRYRLENGRGYWAKFPAAGIANPAGTPVLPDTVPVVRGWNMIGSISLPVDTGDVVSLPPGIRSSPYYGYNGSLVPVTVLEPGRGYWVKVTADGALILSAVPPNPRRGGRDGARR